ncbi:TPA: hypothetical protein ACGJ4G_002277 [Pseudomonas aeruginosa]
MNRSHVIEALRAADWSNTPIGNKALIQAAIEHLEAQPSSAFRPARVISYRPGMGEVTVYTAGGVPGYMNIGDTVYVSDRAPVEQPSAALAQPSPVRSSLLINGYQLRAALEFIAPDGTAEQLESEARIEWRQQDADFLEAGLYAWSAEYPEEGRVLLDDEPTTAQPSPAPTLRAAIDVANDRFEVPVAKWGTDLIGEEGRPKVVARLYRSNAKYFPPFAEVQKPLPPGDGTLTVDPLITLAQYDRDVGALRAGNAKLEKELAMARDAASKGDAARHAAGGMEMEIQELRENVAKLKKELRSRWTYASTQSTNCAGCGEHKHTPLRVDWMGGYVCLTCIDEKLEELHGAQVQHGLPDDDTILQIFADNAEHSERGGEHGYCIVRKQHALKIARELLAATPASSEES